MSRRRTRNQQRTAEQFEEVDKQGHVLPDPTPVEYVTTEGEPGGVGGTTIPIPDEEIDAEVQARDEAAEEIADGMAALDEEREQTQDAPSQDPGLPPHNPFVEPPYIDIEPGEEYDVGVVVGSMTPEPPFDPEIFERGPLAAGIRMCEALLTQAKAGYINEQIDELARVLDVDFPDPERFFLGQVAARETTASGLPDVAGAYRALVRAKAQVGD